MYFKYEEKDEYERQVVVVQDREQADGVYVGCTSFVGDMTYGEGSFVILPRDRVPDLIAALQRFMEETK